MLVSTPMGPGFFIFFRRKRYTGSSDEGKKKKSRSKVYRTHDVYTALKEARKRELDAEISGLELERITDEVKQAEKEVSARLADIYTKGTGKPPSEQSLSAFVKGLNFQSLPSDEPSLDIDQVLLIIMIDELTDE